MSAKDPTLGADSSLDGARPTEMPPTDPARSLDSLQTQPPFQSSRYPVRTRPGDPLPGYNRHLRHRAP
jgi:hypothetical protein